MTIRTTGIARAGRGGLTMLLCLLLLSMATACADDVSLTVSEYAEFCAEGIASAASLIEPDRIVWSELEELATQSARELRSIKPPSELSEFHRASLKAFDFVAGVARDQDPDEAANPLAFGFEAIRIATQLRRSVDVLAPDVRGSLDAAECL